MLLAILSCLVNFTFNFESFLAKKRITPPLLLHSCLVWEPTKQIKQKLITLATIIALLNGIMLVSCQVKNDKNVGGMEKLLRKYLNNAQYSAVVSGLSGGEPQGKILAQARWVFQWKGTAGDNERPFIQSCYCSSIPGKDNCHVGTKIGIRWCGLTIFGSGCIGFCMRDFE